MSPARRIALAITRSAFRFTLFAFVSLLAFYATFGDSSHIKRALSDSNAYTRFVPAIIETNNKQADKETNIFLDKNVQKITTDSFPANKLQVETEKFIDGWYGWLNRQTYEPQFTVDFSTSRKQLATDLSTYAINRLRVLPLCGQGQETLALDPFKATCQPVGVNYDAEELSVRKELVESKDFLPKVTYTAADLPKTNKGESISQAFSLAPFGFGMLWYITWTMLLVLMLLGLATVMLRTVRRQGWKQLGKMMAETGAFIAISGYIFGLLVPSLTRSFQSQFGGNGAEQILNDVIARLTFDFQFVLILASAVLALAGVAIMLLARIFKPVSRYEGLEKVTGLVNGVRPKVRYAKGSRANEAPIVSSERRNSSRNKQVSKQKKSAKVKKELGL